MQVDCKMDLGYLAAPVSVAGTVKILLDGTSKNRYHPATIIATGTMYRIHFLVLFLCSAMVSAQEVAFVPPPVDNAAAPAAFPVTSMDSVLGDRIARISATLEKLPQDHGQMWREFDITPHTQERRLPTGGALPEQAIIDWIVRKTGTHMWHTAPFGILSADSEKLCAYHTREVLLLIADVVDRFVCPQLWNEACTLRIVSTARPDWLNRGHSYLRPIKIATPGVQGWIVDKTVAQNLLTELGRRSDFKELIPPQPIIAHGVQHNVVVKKERQYLRYVQANSSALNGYAEDRVTMDEGIGLTMTSLAVLDGQNMDVNIKLDIVQIERMQTTPVDIATATNSRQRFQLESPQIAYYNLDEIVRFPKSMVLLLDFGTVPLPNTADDHSRNVLTEIARGVNPARRGNVLVFIESTSGSTVPAVSSPSNVAPTRTARNPDSQYWQGVRR